MGQATEKGCETRYLEANSHQVLPCYLQEGSFQPYWTLQNEEVESGVTLDTYELEASLARLPAGRNPLY